MKEKHTPMISQKPLIRPYRPEDKELLLEIWLAASLEAHAFLGHERLVEQKQIVGDQYLAQADTRVLEFGGIAAGFIGLIGDFMGGLFIDPRHQGRGLGRALIQNALGDHGVLELEVYTLNRKAVGFYRHLAFSEVSRRPIDDQGLPFELIRMHKSRKS
jgi:putative acetyltransferase